MKVKYVALVEKLVTEEALLADNQGHRACEEEAHGSRSENI